MKCPHCIVSFHADWTETILNIPNGVDTQWSSRAAVCPSCKHPVIKLLEKQRVDHGYMRRKISRIVHPRFPIRTLFDATVPESFRSDYVEACHVLEASAKASAALSRRVLQSILTDQGYKSSNLAEQIDSVLAESDPKK